MRLWHVDLLPYLPNPQLLGQHRECCALRGKAGKKRHMVIDYIRDSTPVSKCYQEVCMHNGLDLNFNFQLLYYHFYVFTLLKDRKYNISKLWSIPPGPYYRISDKIEKGMLQAIYYRNNLRFSCEDTRAYDYFRKEYLPYVAEHNDLYLFENLLNLYFKSDGFIHHPILKRLFDRMLHVNRLHIPLYRILFNSSPHNYRIENEYTITPITAFLMYKELLENKGTQKYSATIRDFQQAFYTWRYDLGGDQLTEDAKNSLICLLRKTRKKTDNYTEGELCDIINLSGN